MNRWSVVARLALLVVVGACRSTPPEAVAFDAELREETFDLFFDDLEANYPFFVEGEGSSDEEESLDRAAEWKAAVEVARRAALACETRFDYFRTITRQLATLHDEHVSLDLPFANIASADGAWTVPYLELLLVGGQMYLVNAEGGAAGLEQAPELIAIDGVEPTVGLVQPLLAGPAGGDVELTLELADGTRTNRTVQRYPIGTALPRTIHVDLRLDHSSWISWSRKGTVGYIAVRTFNKQQAGVDIMQMKSDVRRAFAAIGSPEGLILDLQYNAGGSFEVAREVGALLVREEALVGLLHNRLLGWISWKHPMRIRPRRNGYHGPLVVLVNGSTGSMAEHLARTLQRSGRALVIGERTLGAEAAVRDVRAADGAELTYGDRRITDRDGVGFQGVGVVPDLELPLLIGDVRALGVKRALFQAHDRRLQAAVHRLGLEFDSRKLPQPEGRGLIVPRLPKAETKGVRRAPDAP